MCLLRGTSLVFKENTLRFVHKGLMYGLCKDNVSSLDHSAVELYVI
jgi:hypothetical protein